MNERKKERKKERNQHRKKDEEAIALATTLEKIFAIGQEAGGAEKGADMCELIQYQSQQIYLFA